MIINLAGWCIQNLSKKQKAFEELGRMKIGIYVLTEIKMIIIFKFLKLFRFIKKSTVSHYLWKIVSCKMAALSGLEVARPW